MSSFFRSPAFKAMSKRTYAAGPPPATPAGAAASQTVDSAVLKASKTGKATFEQAQKTALEYGAKAQKAAGPTGQKVIKQYMGKSSRTTSGRGKSSADQEGGRSRPVLSELTSAPSLPCPTLPSRPLFACPRLSLSLSHQRLARVPGQARCRARQAGVHCREARSSDLARRGCRRMGHPLVPRKERKLLERTQVERRVEAGRNLREYKRASTSGGRNKSWGTRRARREGGWRGVRDVGLHAGDVARRANTVR